MNEHKELAARGLCVLPQSRARSLALSLLLGAKDWKVPRNLILGPPDRR
jgi:hypothetical protein